MPIKMTTFAGSTVRPMDDAMVYDAALGMNGILNGCGVRIEGNNIVVGSGYAIVCGRHLNITTESLTVELAGATALKGRVYIHVDLQAGSDADSVASLQVERAEVLSILTQDPSINFNNGVFDYELATFDITSTALTNLVYTAKQVSSLRNLIGDPTNLGSYTDIISAIKTLGEKTGKEITIADNCTVPTVGGADQRVAASGRAVYDIYAALSRSISSGLSPIMLADGVELNFNTQPYTQTGIWGFNQSNALVNGPYSQGSSSNAEDNGGWLFTISTDTTGCKQFVFRKSTNATNAVQIWHRTYRSSGTTSWQRVVNYSDYANFGGDITFAKSQTSPAIFYYADGTNKTALIGFTGANLWIGANATTNGYAHLGGTYISSGYDKSKKTGYSTAYISVPDAQNNDAKNYGIWHTGNAKCVTLLKETVLRGAGTNSHPYRIYAQDGIFGDKHAIVLNTGDKDRGVFARGQGFYVQDTSGDKYVEAKAKKWNTDSSRLVKENINDITDEEANKLLELRPVSFNYKKEFTDTPEENNFGLIAEEVLEVIPEAVSVPEGYRESDFDISKGIKNKTLSIDYSKLVPHLIKMTQLQQKKIDELEARLARLEAKIGDV